MVRHGGLKCIVTSLLVTILCVNSFSLQTYASAIIDENIGDESDDPIIMVSLGDSYSSGEGIEKFYGQDDETLGKICNPDWLAHRSQNSWPGMLKLSDLEGTMASYKDENWFFVAASGAVTDNLLYPFEKKYKKDGYKGSFFLEPQLKVFDQFKPNTIDYVTLTLGGNDVGFVGIIKTAVKDTLFSVPYLNPSKLSDNINYLSRSSKTELQEIQNADFRRFNNQTSGSSETECADVQEVNPNYNNTNYTDLSYNNPIYQSDSDTERGMDGMDDVNAYIEIIKENIEYYRGRWLQE